MTELTACPLDEHRALRVGCTPIWAAAEAGHKEVVFTLMAAGADTNVANKFGRTALIAAALQAVAYTRPLFGSTSAHFVGYVGCMIFPQSISQGDRERCDQHGLR